MCNFAPQKTNNPFCRMYMSQLFLNLKKLEEYLEKHPLRSYENGFFVVDNVNGKVLRVAASVARTGAWQGTTLFCVNENEIKLIDEH